MVGLRTESFGFGIAPNKRRNITSTTESIPVRRSRPDNVSRQSPIISWPAGGKLPAPVTRPLTTPPSPQVQRLRNLAHILMVVYPAQTECLNGVLKSMSEPDEPGGFIDVRGLELIADQPPVHVFVD